jgi:hypothetical protein
MNNENLHFLISLGEFKVLWAGGYVMLSECGDGEDEEHWPGPITWRWFRGHGYGGGMW